MDIEDREELDHLCEMCEARHVRFMHVMEHPTYPETLRVGCVCAGHMEESLVGARKREAGFKSERNRRARWLSRRWRISAAGNEFLNTNDGFNIVVFPRGAIWGARVEQQSKRISAHIGASIQDLRRSQARRLRRHDRHETQRAVEAQLAAPGADPDQGLAIPEGFSDPSVG